MMGQKKLAEIRKNLEDSLAANGDDPIRRLDRMIAGAVRKGESTDVLQGLKRVLRSSGKKSQRKRRTTRAKSRT